MKKTLYLFLFFLYIPTLYAQKSYVYDEQGMCVAHPKERFFEGIVQEITDLGTGYFMEIALKNTKNKKFVIQVPSNFTEKFQKGKKTKVFFYDTTQLWCVDIKIEKDKKKLKVHPHFKKYAKESFTKKVKYISGIQGDLGKYLTCIDNDKEITMFAPFDIDIDHTNKYQNKMVEILCLYELRYIFLRIE